MKTVTACKCQISPERMKTLFESVKFHIKFLIWTCQISYEIPWLEVSNFIWTVEFPWMEMTYFIWHSLIGSARFHMNIWISLIGNAKFHMNLPVWKYPISHEIPCLEVPNFTWTYEFPCYESLCLEVPNFIWISLLGSFQFHMNVWSSLIGRAKFHMNFLVWKYPISDEQMKLPNLIWSSLIGSAKFHPKFALIFWLEVPSFSWIYLFESTQFYINIWDSLTGTAKFIEMMQCNGLN